MYTYNIIGAVHGAASGIRTQTPVLPDGRFSKPLRYHYFKAAYLISNNLTYSINESINNILSVEFISEKLDKSNIINTNTNLANIERGWI